MLQLKRKIFSCVILIALVCVYFVQFPKATNEINSNQETEIINYEPTVQEEPSVGLLSFNINTTSKITAEHFVNGTMMCKYYDSTKSSLPYYVLYPENIDTSQDLPVIVWLHGSGGIGVPSETFQTSSFIKYLLSLKDFCPNAYIICPQLSGDAHSGRWNTPKSAKQVSDIIDSFIVTHNIDKNNMHIVGHSLGAQGALYVSSNLSIFQSCVALSPYNPGCTILTEIPTIAIVGTIEHGEDSASILYSDKLSQIIGKENIFAINSNHGQLPSIAFSFDENNNGYSDLLEWILGQTQ